MMTPEQLTAELERRLDGPHADEHTAAAAHLCAETVRFLNYATGSHSPAGLVYPSTACVIAGSLSAAAHRMPQLCRQLCGWLDAEDARGYLASDDGTPPGIPIALAAGRLRDAALLAGKLGADLAAVQSLLSGVNGRGPNRPGGA